MVCSICGVHSKSIAVHINKIHKLTANEYIKKYNSKILCEDTEKKHNFANKENSKLAKQALKALTNIEFLKRNKKISQSVSKSILNDKNEIKRRSKLMKLINDKMLANPEYRTVLSERAKITSAKPEVIKNRSAKLKKWRELNPEDFYNKCTKKMINCFQSKPEKKLFEFMVLLDGYSFKRNQFIYSETISNKSHKKQMDIADKNKRIYIEYDGVLHFKPKFGQEVLEKIKKRDQEAEDHILKHNWVLIRVSCDQYIDRNKIEKSYFKNDCLEKIKEILKNNKPGVYKIGNEYEQY